MSTSSNSVALVADIGGTNTRVAFAHGTEVQMASVRRFKNENYAGLAPIIAEYMATEAVGQCDAACVAVAGPVRDSVGTMTNLDWTIDKATLAAATGATNVAILNDLQAQGHALGHLAHGTLTEIIPQPEASPLAARLVIGVGTGFNAAPVLQLETHRVVTPSECGHANLPIRNEEELRLCQFVETAHGFPAVEDVLSGRGLERVYDWLGQEDGDPRPLKAAQIMQAVADGEDRAQRALAVFIKILGTVAGNLSLIHLPFGGVYLVGGVARAVLPYLQDMGFSDSFRDKGRFAGFMRNFGVSVVEDDYAALTGCANHLAASAV
ncbi:ROK family protein [Nereida sp. MMG025]|uniref:glucokinase n=1 Tax=Nereida sp. MMG025 TaxID=2909981 RepID=UPI001F1E426F|nr:ROK family protein [Nereida sp. MMG025]MCF6443353.1 glucokinase [Nereida sp. MMG025]